MKKIKNKEKCNIHNIFHNTFTGNAKYKVVTTCCWWQKKLLYFGFVVKNIVNVALLKKIRIIIRV